GRGRQVTRNAPGKRDARAAGNGIVSGEARKGVTPPETRSGGAIQAPPLLGPRLAPPSWLREPEESPAASPLLALLRRQAASAARAVLCRGGCAGVSPRRGRSSRG